MKKTLIGLMICGAVSAGAISLSTQAQGLWVKRQVCDYTTQLIQTPTTHCHYAGELTGFYNGSYHSLSAAPQMKTHSEYLTCPQELHHMTHRLESDPMTIVTYTGTLTLTDQTQAISIENLTEKVAGSCRMEDVLVPIEF